MKQGKFIVIDGTDGSGKATQAKRLVERFQAEGQAVETISFPQYGRKSAGAVEEYLSGTYGAASEVGPYRASVLYAVDRFDAAPRIRAWLEAGTHVVADRYVGSNLGHQGSKITDRAERKKFFDWALEFEHGLLGIPRPDLNVILHVPADTAMSLIRDRASKHGLSRDIHEQDPEHLRLAEASYLDLAKRVEGFRLLECMENGALLSPEEVHGRLWEMVENG